MLSTQASCHSPVKSQGICSPKLRNQGLNCNRELMFSNSPLAHAILTISILILEMGFISLLEKARRWDSLYSPCWKATLFNPLDLIHVAGGSGIGFLLKAVLNLRGIGELRRKCDFSLTRFPALKADQHHGLQPLQRWKAGLADPTQSSSQSCLQHSVLQAQHQQHGHIQCCFSTAASCLSSGFSHSLDRDQRLHQRMGVLLLLLGL